MLHDAVRYLLPEFQEDGSASAAAAAKKEPDTEEERLVLEIVETLDRDGKGASWDEIVDAAGKKGLSKEQLEEITNRLLDDGSLYEPILGKIRRI
jgi:DNA replicative helicase MCM subunit Mcm2 (Cdc46/Mcm family)